MIFEVNIKDELLIRESRIPLFWFEVIKNNFDEVIILENKFKFILKAEDIKRVKFNNKYKSDMKEFQDFIVQLAGDSNINIAISNIKNVVNILPDSMSVTSVMNIFNLNDEESEKQLRQLIKTPDGFVQIFTILYGDAIEQYEENMPMQEVYRQLFGQIKDINKQYYKYSLSIASNSISFLTYEIDKKEAEIKKKANNKAIFINAFSIIIILIFIFPAFEYFITFVNSTISKIKIGNYNIIDNDYILKVIFGLLIFGGIIIYNFKRLIKKVMIRYQNQKEIYKLAKRKKYYKDVLKGEKRVLKHLKDKRI